MYGSGLRVGELVARLRRPFLAALTMVVGVWAAQRSLLHAVDMPVLRLLAAVGLGITIYLAALSALWRLEGAPAGIERRVLTLMGR